jgi:hypothetical protein
MRSAASLWLGLLLFAAFVVAAGSEWLSHPDCDIDCGDYARGAFVWTLFLSPLAVLGLVLVTRGAKRPAVVRSAGRGLTVGAVLLGFVALATTSEVLSALGHNGDAVLGWTVVSAVLWSLTALAWHGGRAARRSVRVE